MSQFLIITRNIYPENILQFNHPGQQAEIIIVIFYDCVNKNENGKIAKKNKYYFLDINFF